MDGARRINVPFIWAIAVCKALRTCLRTHFNAENNNNVEYGTRELGTIITLPVLNDPAEN